MMSKGMRQVVCQKAKPTSLSGYPDTSEGLPHGQGLLAEVGDVLFWEFFYQRKGGGGVSKGTSKKWGVLFLLLCAVQKAVCLN